MASKRMKLESFGRFLLLAALLGAAWFGGCGEGATDGRERIEIAGETWTFEVAADDASRTRGLGGRASLADGEGMIFIFPDARQRSFWMYDCLIPIDIAFVDGLGTVTAVHSMPNEPLRAADESESSYRARLPMYPSRFPAQFALEFPAGTIERLGLALNDRIDLDARRLKGLAK